MNQISIFNNRGIRTIFLLTIVWFFFFLGWEPFQVQATPFHHNTSLSIIRTANFDIIFPTESTETGLYLASIAEPVYEQISYLLDTELPRRMPVVLTEDTEVLNGFFTPFPYNRIMLYHVPSEFSGALGNFDRDLKRLFIHELTHAVSINSRGPITSFLASVFSDAIAPSVLFMGMEMIEGVSVSFESIKEVTAPFPYLEESGRVYDPFSAQMIRQDIVEERFLEHEQVLGSRDLYPGLVHSYIYGGYFSYYLQQKYGLKKYAQLWHNAGRSTTFKRNIEQTYGISIDEAWQGFKKYMKVDEALIKYNAHTISPRYYEISAAVAENGLIYFYCARNRALMSLDPADGEHKLIKRIRNGFITNIDAKDEKLLLSMQVPSRTGRALVVKTYNLGQKQIESTVEQKGIREAVFFNKGLIGISIKQGRTDLVYYHNNERDENRTLYPLLKGSRHISVGAPKKVDDTTIAFLGRVDGDISIYLYTFLDPMNPQAGGDIKKIDVSKTAVDFIRDIQVYNQIIYFIYNADNSFSRLGYIKGNNLFLQKDIYSGGVFSPVPFDSPARHNDTELEKSIYYVGHFSEGHKFLLHPGEFVSDRFELSDAGLLNDNQKTIINHDVHIGPYRALPYVSRFSWFPMTGPGPEKVELYPITAAGGIFFFGDPTERNQGFFHTTYNWKANFINAGFELSNYSTPLDIHVSLKDVLLTENIYGSNDGFIRSTQAGIDISRWYYLPLSETIFQLAISAQGGLESLRVAENLHNVSSPYKWQYEGFYTLLNGQIGFNRSLGKRSRWGMTSHITLLDRRLFEDNSSSEFGLMQIPQYEQQLWEAGARLSLSSLFTGPYQPFNREGWEAILYGDYSISAATVKIEATTTWVPVKQVPLLLRVYGGWSPSRTFQLSAQRAQRENSTADSERAHFIYYRYPMYREYLDYDVQKELNIRDPQNSILLGDVSVGLFNIEIQRKLPLLPFYLRRMYSELGYRAAYFADIYLHSAYAGLYIDLNPHLGMAGMFDIYIGIETAYAFNTGKWYLPIDAHMFSIQLSL